MIEEGCFPTLKERQRGLKIMGGIASVLEGIGCRARFTMDSTDSYISLYIHPIGEPFTKEERGGLVRDIDNALGIQGGVWEKDFQEFAGYHRFYRQVRNYKGGFGLAISIDEIEMPNCRIEKKTRTETIYEAVCT